MLDFCGQHQITPEIERLPLEQLNVAYERLRRNDVRCRFVIDLSKTDLMVHFEAIGRSLVLRRKFTG
jgi:hypothetical protein